MKKLHWMIIGAVVVGLAMGALLAAAIRTGSITIAQRVPGNVRTSTEVAATDFIGELELNDEVEPGSDFYRFREQLREAVQKRDRRFVKSIIPATGLAIGFSVPRSSEELNLDDPRGQFWSQLEKAIAVGCTLTENWSSDAVDPDSEIWECPKVNQALARQFSESQSQPGVSWAQDHVAIVGENVNVRSQPRIDSSVIGTLSNQVMRRDRQQPIDPNFDPIDGWTAVMLPIDRPGYIYNRYVYAPLEYRALFGKVDGEWQLLHMPGGD